MSSLRTRSLRGRPIIPDCGAIPEGDVETRLLYGCPVIRRDENEAPPVSVNESEIVKKPIPVPKTFPTKKRLNQIPIALSLDLDETFVHSVDPSYRFRDGTYDRMNPEYRKLPNYYSIKCDDGEVLEGLVRPYTKEFLEIAFDLAYPLFVFTAGSKPYAEEICNIIFPNRKPTKVYSRDDCNKEFDKNMKPILLIQKEFPDMLTDGRLLIIDDRHEVYYPVDHRMVFKIHPWYGRDMNDSHLLEVSRLLIELCSHSRSVCESPLFDRTSTRFLYKAQTR